MYMGGRQPARQLTGGDGVTAAGHSGLLSGMIPAHTTIHLRTRRV